MTATSGRHVLFALEGVKVVSYQASTIRALVDEGYQVTVLIPSTDPKDVNDLACRELILSTGGRVTIEWVAGRLWNRLAAFTVGLRELRSYGSYLRRRGQSSYYRERWRGNLMPWSRRLARWFPVDFALRVPGVDAFLQWLEQLLPADSRAVEHLKRLQPSLVVASPTNHAQSEELEYVKGARKLGIANAVAVHSWDNLSTKGLLPPYADRVLVWNEEHRRQAVELHGISEARVRVTGSPFFDKWWEIDRSAFDRNAFCAHVGLDPARPYLLYLGSSPAVEPSGKPSVEALALAFSTSAEARVRELQILVRPHPANGAAFQGLSRVGVAVWPREGVLPDSASSRADFVASVIFSETTLGINTTGMMDAVALDHPCLCWLQESRRGTQADAQHFQELLKSDALEIVDGPKAAVCWLERHFQGAGDTKAGARLELVLRLVRPQGLKVSAGATAASALTELLVGLSEAPQTKLRGLEPERVPV